MNFIAIRDGVKLRKEDIIKIERMDGMRCKVFTSIGEEESVYSYETLGWMLEMGNIEENISTSLPADNPNVSRNLWGGQHWAG